MPRLTLALLGGFQGRLDASAPLALPTRKTQALLAFLSLPPGRSHPREKLASLLWGGMLEPQARQGLRQSLFTLRKAVGAEPPALLIDGKTVALNPALVEVDVMEFERQIAEGTPAALERAADLYRGELLEGLALREAPFEEWLLAERERLRELALEALAKLLRHQRDAGATEAALQTALRLLALDPLQEPVHRTVMRLYVQLGRRASALRQYQVCLGVSARELGVEPETATQQLYREILRQRPPRAASDVESPATARAAPAQTPASRDEILPRELPLVGREAEIHRLREVLNRAWTGHGHVVALIGEAGVGKTPLAGRGRRRSRGARGSRARRALLRGRADPAVRLVGRRASRRPRRCRGGRFSRASILCRGRSWRACFPSWAFPGHAPASEPGGLSPALRERGPARPTSRPAASRWC